MPVSAQPPDRSAAILSDIESRFGFVPPFFMPAAAQPDVLLQLWRHSLSAYVDSPLPELFKERLAAALGRYCAVRYCMMCHMCSLRPLGMRGADILALMTRATPNAAEIAASADRIVRSADACSMDSSNWPAELEADIMALSISIYRSDAMAHSARTSLAASLSPADYNRLISFISYNHMCHDWVEAHPELSFELDQRFIENYRPLVDEVPDLPALVDSHALKARRSKVEKSILLADVGRMEQISERRLEQVLRDMTSRLDVARNDAARDRVLFDELQRTAVFAQELLAIVSHDLRNPLGAISNSAYLLSRHSDAQVLMLGGVVKRSAERAIGLIGDLLDYSQARIGGGIPTHRLRLNINDVLADIVSAMHDSDPDRTITLETQGDGTGSWDGERLHQATVNLLANALKHSPPQSTVSVSCMSSESVTTISISNENATGPIPEQIREHLFEPFKRYSTAKSNTSRSVGLGLYIVSQIVQGHDGTIEVESTDAQTVFRMVLPRSA